MNLAERPQAIRAEIEQDKQRWFRAWQMTQGKRPAEIRVWLSRIDDEEEKNDWRRRLNAMRHRSPFNRNH